MSKEDYPLAEAAQQIRDWYESFPLQGRHMTREEHSKLVTTWYHNLRNKHHLGADLIRNQ